MMHLRQPSFDRGVTSFLWAFGLGAYVWLGLVAVGVGVGTALLLGLLAGLGIFFLVLFYGGEEFR